MRLIDADRLKEKKYYTLQSKETGQGFKVVVFEDIDNAPTVDAVPVVRGKWVTTKTQQHDGEPYCNCCGEAPYRKSDYELPNYCPHCGAKMEG
jgi:hypothetical protein